MGVVLKSELNGTETALVVPFLTSEGLTLGQQ